MYQKETPIVIKSLTFSGTIFQKEYEKIMMTIDNKSRDKKLQYDINKEAVKISGWSSGNDGVAHEILRNIGVKY